MATGKTQITIDSGPIDANDLLRNVPKDKWRELMLARRQFMEINLSYDCRCLIQFVNDSKSMYEVLGFKNVDEMIYVGYGLIPQEINIALKWLELNPSDKPIPLEVTLGKRGRPKKGEEKGNDVTFIRGNRTAYLLARLARDRPDILGQFNNGEFKSVRAAAIAAGIIHEKTPLEYLESAWAKASEDERRSFLMAHADYGH